MKTMMISLLGVAALLLGTTGAQAQQPAPLPDDSQQHPSHVPLPLLSETESFQALSGPERLPLSLTVNVSRFTGTAIIELVLPYEGEVSLMVGDLYGNIVASILEQRLEPARHVITWIPKDIRPGIYFITAHVDEQIQSVRVEIAR
jgi:hypothetical protein